MFRGPWKLPSPDFGHGNLRFNSAVTVTTAATAALTITSATTNPADFNVLSNRTNSVPPNTNRKMVAFFDPTVSGNRSETLTIRDNFPGGPQTVVLIGTGQNFSFAPSSAGSVTVPQGQAATYGVAVVPTGGFNRQ